MTGDPHGENGVTDEQVADLERRFGRAGVVELTYQIGLENMRARMYSALGITEQGGSAPTPAVCPGQKNDALIRLRQLSTMLRRYVIMID